MSAHSQHSLLNKNNTEASTTKYDIECFCFYCVITAFRSLSVCLQVLEGSFTFFLQSKVIPFTDLHYLLKKTFIRVSDVQPSSADLFLVCVLFLLTNIWSATHPFKLEPYSHIAGRTDRSSCFKSALYFIETLAVSTDSQRNLTFSLFISTQDRNMQGSWGGCRYLLVCVSSKRGTKYLSKLWEQHLLR